MLNNYSAEFSPEDMSPDQAASVPHIQVCVFHPSYNHLLSRWCLEAFVTVQSFSYVSLPIEGVLGVVFTFHSYFIK